MAQYIEQLPYEIGRPARTWRSRAGVLGAFVAVGLVAYILELTEGMGTTGLRNIGPMGGATWGLYITFVIYFVGTSFAGISVAALVRLFNIKALEPITRTAELLTVVTLMLAAMAIAADLGNPVRGILNLLIYARPQSPFFGTFTLVISGYLFASSVYLYLEMRRDAAICAGTPSKYQKLYRWLAAGYSDTPAERRRHRKAGLWLAVAIAPLLVTAHSTLGFVFGLQVGRPGWHSALQAPAFVILAGVSGVGLLAVMAWLFRNSLHERRLGDDVFGWLRNILGALLLIYLYFWVVDLVTALYQGDRAELTVTRAVLVGPYAWIYWASAACLIIPMLIIIVQKAKRSTAVAPLVVAGAMVQFAAIGKRFLIVVPSQTYGTLLPYGAGSYIPSWSEFAIAVGLIALGALMIGAYARVFPIIPLEDPRGSED